MNENIENFINEHCEYCILRSNALLDNHLLTLRMKGIVKTSSHNALYMMGYFADIDISNVGHVDMEHREAQMETNKDD